MMDRIASIALSVSLFSATLMQCRKAKPTKEASKPQLAKEPQPQLGPADDARLCKTQAGTEKTQNIGDTTMHTAMDPDLKSKAIYSVTTENADLKTDDKPGSQYIALPGKVKQGSQYAIGVKK